MSLILSSMIVEQMNLEPRFVNPSERGQEKLQTFPVRPRDNQEAIRGQDRFAEAGLAEVQSSLNFGSEWHTFPA